MHEASTQSSTTLWTSIVTLVRPFQHRSTEIASTVARLAIASVYCYLRQTGLLSEPAASAARTFCDKVYSDAKVHYERTGAIEDWRAKILIDLKRQMLI